MNTITKQKIHRTHFPDLIDHLESEKVLQVNLKEDHCYLVDARYKKFKPKLEIFKNDVAQTRADLLLSSVIEHGVVGVKFGDKREKNKALHGVFAYLVSRDAMPKSALKKAKG